MTRLLRCGVVLALLAAEPVAVRAQSPSNKVTLNIAAGLSLPTGSFSNGNDAGYNLIVGAGVMPPLSQLGFRVEGIYTEFNAKDFNEKSHAGGVTANVVYDLNPVNPRQPGSTIYLIGGAGYYSTRDVFFDNGGNLGWNVGGGFRFPLSGFSAYLEARYHAVTNTEVRFVPISFGLEF